MRRLAVVFAADALLVLVGWVAATPAAGSQPGDSPGLVLSGSVESVHDPAIVRHGDGYYLYSTSHVGEAPGLIHWRVSNDLRHWTLAGAVFPRLPEWANEHVPGTRGLWAPDILYADGEYRLYYSVSTFGSNRSAIGLAVTKSLDPDGDHRWVDRGVVFASDHRDDFNAIDPSVFIDDEGAHWMAFGSFWSGIKMIALDPTTGLRSQDDVRIRNLARRPSPGAVEAPFMIRRNGRYYLFVSFDFCCRGADSTYYTVVGRSGKPTGPFVDRDGTRMMRGGGFVVLHADLDPAGRFAGPGHVAVLRDGEVDYIVYHAYDTQADGRSTLRIQRLDWTDDGWPVAIR